MSSDFGWKVTCSDIPESSINQLGKVKRIPAYYKVTLEATRNTSNREELYESVRDMWDWAHITFGDTRDYDGNTVWSFSHVTLQMKEFNFRNEHHRTLFVLRYKGT